jgi:FkbM family methyltransferase
MVNIGFIKEVGPFRWVFRTVVRQFYKRIVKRDHTMRLPTGEWITLPVSNHFASEAFVTHGDVDWGSERLLEALLSRKGVFLDVGAHIGYYSLYVLPRVLAVYSFEPDPQVRVFLQNNVSKKPNIEIIPCAVGATQGKARFTLELAAEVSHLSGKEEKAENQIEVDVVTVDAFVASRKLTVEGIKIDAEGHDINVIRGALAVLEQQKPLVLTEAKPDAALFDLMNRVTYRVFAYVRNPQTRSKFFAELLSHVPIPGETKMLFLIPDGLAEEIIRQADRHHARP